MVGHDVRLNDTPVEITSIDLASRQAGMAGNLVLLVPAGLPRGLYDITLRSPDGRLHLQTFLLEDGQAAYRLTRTGHGNDNTVVIDTSRLGIMDISRF